MEFWKFVLIWLASLIAKSFVFIWALNELFSLGIEYSLLSFFASTVFLFCIGSWEPEKKFLKKDR